MQTITIKGTEFVLLERREYERLVGGQPVDAIAYGLASLGNDLRQARETAGLTQAELAKKLRRSQAMVSSAESGTMHIGERYVRAVLKACGLPENWKPRKRPVRRSAPQLKQRRKAA